MGYGSTLVSGSVLTSGVVVEVVFGFGLARFLFVFFAGGGFTTVGGGLLVPWGVFTSIMVGGGSGGTGEMHVNSSVLKVAHGSVCVL